jgi:hypothetical protein
LLEDRVVPVVALPPTGLVATGVSPSQIGLTWAPSPDPTVTGFDVIEKVWIAGIHGGKGSGGGGHWAYNQVASNLTDTSATLSGLAVGSTHTYMVTAVNADGQSLYSVPAAAETWIAPSFANGPNIFLLSNGALWSGSLNVTATLTTQIRLLINGNPLTFAIDSGPSTASIDPSTGALTYTPDPSEVGPVSITAEASNSLGTIQQTISFNVNAINPNLATPTLILNATSSTYTGYNQGASATAIGADGVTPVSGTFAFAYNGTGLAMNAAGTYTVLVTFTSYDPNYSNATLLTTFTINQGTPSLNYVTSATIAQGTATTALTGYASLGPIVPAGEYVIVALNGVAVAAPISTNGTFTAAFPTGALDVGEYTITYGYAGDANLTAADTAFGTLDVIPTAPPQITANPTNHTVSAGDGVSFTAAATGSPTPTVQWQVSTDGGTTWANITGNTSAQTATLTFITNLGQNGYKYRAVFTNPLGTATTTVATLTVENDN